MFIFENNFKLNIMKQSEKIKSIKKELKEWKSYEVKNRFESVGSTLHIKMINELTLKLKRFDYDNKRYRKNNMC